MQVERNRVEKEVKMRIERDSNVMKEGNLSDQGFRKSNNIRKDEAKQDRQVYKVEMIVFLSALVDGNTVI